MIRFYLLITLFFMLTDLMGQNNMQEGFNFLEKGNFEKAESFFANYLKTSPNDKTALLCYARAVGLSGEPIKATRLFAKLQESYPTDFEVKINYNESFLWAKKYTEAKPLYAQMVTNYPNEFTVLLGYANTLSNLKEYKEALKFVEKAIDLEPKNKSAKISRKYMRLGLANRLINNQNYQSGEKLLEEIFVDFPEDKDALLNLANLYLITKQVERAKQMYKRHATSPKDSITSLIGIALAEHIGEKDKQALVVARLAKEKIIQFNDFELTERTHERYVQALIWNRKFILARRQIDNLANSYQNRNWVYALRATLHLYVGESKNSITNYNALLKNDSTSFDGNLGKANALFAADQIDKAYIAVQKTLQFYPNQKDATQFIEKLDVLHTPTIEEHAGYTFDNGNNIAFFSNTTTALPLSTKFKTNITYGFRATENTVSKITANTHLILIGLEYKLAPKTTIKTVLGLNNSRFMEEVYTQPILDTRVLLQSFKLQNISLGYQREVQNFNADLIAQEIVQNHFGLNYNLSTNFGLGWYTQLMHTEQSDENTRDLLFTSLYYNLFKKPALKLGVNYQHLAFKDQVPILYFSPKKYQALELFGDFRTSFDEKTNLIANAAIGKQQVENDSFTTIFRSEVTLQQQFSKRLSANLYGKYSNIASATAAGFEFTEIGFKLKWLFTKEPLF